MSYITITQNAFSPITTGFANTIQAPSVPSSSILDVCATIFKIALGDTPAKKTALIPFENLEAELMSIEGFKEHFEAANKEIASTYLSDVNDIRTMRLSKGLSQSTLAKRLGTSQSHVNKFENGLVDPKLKTVIKMAQILEVDEQSIINALKKEPKWNQQ